MTEVLYVTTYPPTWGTKGGAAGVDHRIVSALRAAGHDCEIFSLCTGGTGSVPLELSSRQLRIFVLTNMLLRRQAYQVAKFASFRRAWDGRRAALHSAARGRLVIASHFPALLLARDAGVPVKSYIAHNLEFKLADAHSPLPLRILNDHQRLRRVELSALRYAKTVCCLSAVDASELAELLSRPCASLPVPLIASEFAGNSVNGRPPGSPQRSLGFVGKATWPPNQESLETLLHQVLPAVQRRVPQVELFLAGSGTEVFSAVQRVHAYGEVPSLDEFWSQVDILALPRFGNPTGVSMKALEASEWGVQSVVGMRVLSAVPDAPWRSARDLREFVDQTVDVLTNPAGDRERIQSWVEGRSPARLGALISSALVERG